MADQEETVFLYVGTYADEPTAHSDYKLVQELHKAKAVGSYDAVVVIRDDTGKIHVNKDETAFRHGGWGGAAAGAVVGLIFPPAVLGAAAVGAAAGAVGGHLRRGLSRSDVDELGDLLAQGEAALVVVGRTRLADVLDKGRLSAVNHVYKELGVDPKHIDEAVRQAVREMG
jgi:uncharacterized membrane protein